MATLGELYRYYTVVVNNGSGCLFQPPDQDFTYVLTVKHNLQTSQTLIKITLNIKYKNKL